MLPDITTLFQANNILLVFKVLLLVLLFVYILFTFVVSNRVRALNRTMHLSAAHASVLLQIATLLSFLVAVSLFIATLVIV
jgi:hypothetical protein